LDRAFAGDETPFATCLPDFLDRGRFSVLSSLVLLRLVSVVEQEKGEKAGQNSEHGAENSEPK
jgi:hypothetical protein